jgi:hypothetical protein
MCQRGLDAATAVFESIVREECQNGDKGWANSLSVLHAKLEDEFMHSPAGTGIYRVSVAYLVALAGLCSLAWVGFPSAQFDYAEELQMSTASRAEAVAADIVASGGGLASVDQPARRSKDARRRTGAAPTGLARYLTVTNTWGLLNAAAFVVTVLCIVLGFSYYSVPETISQQWEDAFLGMHPTSFRNFPKVHACSRLCVYACMRVCVVCVCLCVSLCESVFPAASQFVFFRSALS